MSKVTSTWAAVAILTVISAAGLTACSAGKPRLASTMTTTGPGVRGEPVTLTVSPETGATRQPVSTEIGIDASGGEVTDVTLTDGRGSKITGAMREDGSSWIPAAALAYSQTYTATVTATGPSGQVTTRTTSFSTMGRPASTVTSGLNLSDRNTYGVAVPVVVQFSPGVAKADRAAAQRRMFVRTDPPQPGAWSWLSNGTQAYYRAPHYWKPRTTIGVRIALEGVPLGGGRYGDADRKVTAHIGGKLEMKINNTTKKMAVYDNGVLVKTLPVSLGKKSTPSSSGTSVVMEKKPTTVFDTRSEPNPANRYVVTVQWAQRLTWGGEYIHAAPWSVAQQGRTNVSHGCVNVSNANAKWLFGKTKIGDPVTVSGTGQRLRPGNGWTAWNMSWNDFIKGSAIPVLLTTAPTTPASAISPGPGGPEPGGPKPGGQSGQ